MAKNLLLVIVLFLFCAGQVSAQTEMIVGDMNHDGRLTIEDVTLLTSTMLGDRDVELQVYLDSDEHEYVDLGLPSGTLWATCNVGASCPEEYGDYFAWGEVKPKAAYTWAQYKWMKEGYANQTGCTEYTYADGVKSGCWYEDGVYVGKNKRELDPKDDAAYMNWGVEWRMPTAAQIEELCNNTTRKVINQNGVSGRMFTSKANGAKLFLPAAGYYDGSTIYNDGGGYWTSSLGDDGSYSAYLLEVTPLSISSHNADRYSGRTVRPVRRNKNAE